MKRLILALLAIASVATAQTTTPVSPSGLPLSSGIPGVVQPANTDSGSSSVTISPDISISGTILTGGNSASLALNGRNGASVVLGAGLTGQINCDISYDNTVSWVNVGCLFFNYSTNLGTFGGITYSMSAAGGFSRSLIVPPGTTHLRLRASLAGVSASYILTTTNAVAQPLVNAFGQIDLVNIVPPMGIQIGGSDNVGGFRASWVKNSYSSITPNVDYGLIVRNIPLNNEDRQITISFNESVVAPTAATWYVKRRQAPQISGAFYPAKAFSTVTTAGSRTMINVCLNMGSFNVSTNVFTDGNLVAQPRFYSRLFAVVSTVMSAVANTVTVTYTNQGAGAGRATAALTIPASAPVGNAFEFVLNATSGQENDAGVIDVTAVVDTAAPTGVLDIWGCNPLLDALGVANAMETASFDNFKVVTPETIMIFLQQAATTAQQRGATLSGAMRQ